MEFGTPTTNLRNVAQTSYHLLADLVILAHFAFVIFAVLGGILVLRWRKIVWIHLAAVVWSAAVEFFDWICPLTPIENWFREKAAEPIYHSDFIARYLLPVLYPDGLTRNVQIALGTLVLILNLAIYVWVFSRRTK